MGATWRLANTIRTICTVAMRSVATIAVAICSCMINIYMCAIRTNMTVPIEIPFASRLVSCLSACGDNNLLDHFDFVFVVKST